MMGTIKGQVIIRPGSRPAAAVDVTFRYAAANRYTAGAANASRRLCTRADGSFHADGLAPGAWIVQAQGASAVRIDVLAGSATELTLEVSATHVGSARCVASSHPIVGRSPDQGRLSDDPWPDIARCPPLDARDATQRPDLWREPDTTDGLDGLDAHDIAIGTPGAPGATGHEPVCAEPRAGQPVEDLVRGGVRGRVVFADDGTPVADAAILIVNGWGSSPDIAPLSSPQGCFTLDRLEPGLWIVRAMAPDGTTGEGVVAVRAGAISDVVIELGYRDSGWDSAA